MPKQAVDAGTFPLYICLGSRPQHLLNQPAGPPKMQGQFASQSRKRAQSLGVADGGREVGKSSGGGGSPTEPIGLCALARGRKNSFSGCAREGGKEDRGREGRSRPRAASDAWNNSASVGIGTSPLVTESSEASPLSFPHQARPPFGRSHRHGNLSSEIAFFPQVSDPQVAPFPEERRLLPRKARRHPG